jgi:prolyl-tRNA editing enzyme YbaK/EbsC (Cys-tRNA(Pro) deacylase)
VAVARPVYGIAMNADPRVLDVLEAIGLPYEVMPCDPAYADTAAFCEHYGVSPNDSANTILVASRRPPGRLAACVVLATTRLDVNRAVCSLLEVRKASFADAELTLATTGMEIGGVTPFGLPADLPVFVDSAVMVRPVVVVGAGSRSAKIRLAPAVLAALPAARVIEGLASPAE